MKIPKLLPFAGSLLVMGLLVHAEPLQTGAPAPEASCADQEGNMVNLKDVFAKGPTLVYFYPKADTPGCTKEGCSLRDNWKALQDKGIQVLGVSEDTVAEEKAFHDKFTFPFPLLADHDGKVAAAFGVPLFGGGHAKRQSFLVKDGKVVWNMLAASTDKQAADVLAAYENLAK